MVQTGLAWHRRGDIGMLPAGVGMYRLPRGIERYAFAALVLLLQLLAIWLMWRASAATVLRGGREHALQVQLFSEPDALVQMPAQLAVPREQSQPLPHRRVLPRSKASSAATDQTPQPAAETPAFEPSSGAAAPNLSAPLDTEAIREALRQSMRQQRQPPALAGLMPAPIEPRSKLARDIEQSVRQDCRHAYDSAGLLAVIPLAIDTLRDKGCKW